MSHPGICFPLKHSTVSNDSVCGQRRPWSDCADAQSDQGLRYLHMPEDPFSYAGAHVMKLLQRTIVQPSDTVSLAIAQSKDA